jgi:flagellar basal body-associated protein FliL
VSSKESPYKRPYKSRRQRQEAKDGIDKPKEGKFLLRLLAALVVVLIVAIVFIVKDVGKSQTATGSALSQSQ